MKRETVIGAGCGCAAALVGAVAIAFAAIGLAWAAYEEGMTDMGGEVAVPLGIAIGLVVGALLGGAVFFLMQMIMRKKSAE